MIRERAALRIVFFAAARRLRCTRVFELRCDFDAGGAVVVWADLTSELAAVEPHGNRSSVPQALAGAAARVPIANNPSANRVRPDIFVPPESRMEAIRASCDDLTLTEMGNFRRNEAGKRRANMSVDPGAYGAAHCLPTALADPESCG
jgi:hypothetical protein